MANKVNVLITVEFSAEQLTGLASLSPNINIVSKPLAQGIELPEGEWASAEILYTFRALPLPEQAPNLRWIQFHLAGIDEYVDVPILRKPDLQATTISGGNAPQVAEHALALMLSLGHHVGQMLKDQSQRQWPSKRSQIYLPSELIGSTVGIVGYGSVGQRLARLLQAFGVTILASKRDLLNGGRSNFQVDGQGDPAAALVRRLYPGKALRTMLKDCDFIVIAVPLTAETRGLIGAKQLAALKPSAYLIDVSRGGVVNHEALIEALKNKNLAGAALDVFSEEPLPADSPLWELPNVIISPHVAGFSSHYIERAFSLFKENLRRYLVGDQLLNKVDLERGY